MMINRKRVILIISIVIQLLMLVALFFSIYIPKVLIKPQGSFLYISADDVTQDYRYQVREGRLVKEKSNQSASIRKLLSSAPSSESKLYIYKTEDNKAFEISSEKAKKLFLDPSSQSPDGFEILCAIQKEGVISLFLGPIRNCNSRYIAGHGVSKEINLIYNKQGSYRYRFLGWVLAQEDVSDVKK